MKHDFAAVHRVFHSGPVPDVGFSKLDSRGKLGRHAGAVEIIEYHDMARIRADKLLHQVPSDKAGAARYQDLHRLQVYSARLVEAA